MNRRTGGAALARATEAEDEGRGVDQDFAAARDEAADACETLASMARSRRPASPEMAAACARALQAVGVLSALTNLLVRVPLHR